MYELGGEGRYERRGADEYEVDQGLGQDHFVGHCSQVFEHRAPSRRSDRTPYGRASCASDLLRASSTHARVCLRFLTASFTLSESLLNFT
jgi:hypothetical protein